MFSVILLEQPGYLVLHAFTSKGNSTYIEVSLFSEPGDSVFSYRELFSTSLREGAFGLGWSVYFPLIGWAAFSVIVLDANDIDPDPDDDGVCVYTEEDVEFWDWIETVGTKVSCRAVVACDIAVLFGIVHLGEKGLLGLGEDCGWDFFVFALRNRSFHDTSLWPIMIAPEHSSFWSNAILVSFFLNMSCWTLSHVQFLSLDLLRSGISEQGPKRCSDCCSCVPESVIWAKLPGSWDPVSSYNECSLATSIAK